MSRIASNITAVCRAAIDRKIASPTDRTNSTPRANPSIGYPSIACPAPGKTSDRVDAACASTSRFVTPRMTAANGVPQVSHTSSTIGLCAPQTLHGQNGSPFGRAAVVGIGATRLPAPRLRAAAPAAAVGTAAGP